MDKKSLTWYNMITRILEIYSCEVMIMDIQLAKNLKSLRQKNNKTQDDLALFLSISAQAVSKWERNEGFPDITLLPKIAGYFHVSVDELLGVGEIAKQNRIEEITAAYNRIRHHIPLDPGYRLEEGIELIRNALMEIPGVFFFEQLLAADLYWKGAHTSDPDEKTNTFHEAIALCEDILARSTADNWRNSAKQILLVVYANLGMAEKALELACQMPNSRTTCEYMLTYVLKGDELQNRRKTNAVLYYQIFRESVMHLSEDGLEAEGMLQETELSVAGVGKREFLSAIENVLLHR